MGTYTANTHYGVHTRLAAGCLELTRVTKIPRLAKLLQVKRVSFLDLDGGHSYDLEDCAQLLQIGSDMIAVCHKVCRISDVTVGDTVVLAPGIWRISTD
jgi:hypothetical protein